MKFTTNSTQGGENLTYLKGKEVKAPAVIEKSK